MHPFGSRIFPALALGLAFAAAPLAQANEYANELVEASRARSLSNTTQWHRLGHYDSGLFGGHTSQVIASNFFLSPEGRGSPQAELEATIRGFFAPEPAPSQDKTAQHPQCAFPARYLWLKRELGFAPSKLPELRCERFGKFKDSMRAKSASVVFSSYYLNNPSSAFGHSFIRLNKADHSVAGDRHELLDYGISYAAVMGDENPAVYAFKGMFGMFPGTFTSVPYYYKVREYNDFETRDLWEYDVKLSPEQVEMLVAHIWELGPTFFAYWYLTANCSYQVLTVLEAANPQLTLTRRQSKIVIPVDTIKVVMEEPGFVNAVHFRPSVRALFDKRVAQLPEERLKDLRKLVVTRDPANLDSSLRPEEKAALLDAAADYIDSRHGKEIYNREGEAARWKQAFLVARSQIPIPSAELETTASQRDMPHMSHGSRRVDLDAGYSRELGAFQRLAYRFSLHDLLDPVVGYPENAQIEMFGARIRHNASGDSVWLDDLMIFNVTSLSPIERFNSAFSWRVSFGGRRFYDKTCDYCAGPNFETGAGYAFKPIPRVPLSAFFLVEGQLAASPTFKGSHFRPGAGPAAGLRVLFSDSLITMARGSYRYQAFVDNPHTFEADWSLRWGFHRSWAAQVRATALPNSVETAAGLMFYH
jgi:hypothetical protein